MMKLTSLWRSSHKAKQSSKVEWDEIDFQYCLYLGKDDLKMKDQQIYKDIHIACYFSFLEQ